MKSLSTLTLLVLLAGCQATVFDVLPAGTTAQCPLAWRGEWRGLDDNAQPVDDFAVSIDVNCSIKVRTAKGAVTELRGNYLHTTNGNIVLLRHADVAALVDWHDESAQRLDGYWAFRWSRDDDVLELVPIDHRRVANLIVNGALTGETHWNGGDRKFETSYNIVHGDDMSMQEVFSRFDLFNADKPLRLRLVKRK